MIIQCPACATNFFLDERKFNGLDELQKQLKEDQLSAIKIIENEKIRN